MPGNESEGIGVCARVKSTPPRASFASSESGWFCTYHCRSDWWSPSTEISRTCETGEAECAAAPPVVAATIDPASSAATSPRLSVSCIELLLAELERGLYDGRHRSMFRSCDARVNWGRARAAPRGAALNA